MKTITLKKSLSLLAFLFTASLLTLSSCKKEEDEHVPPDMVFKTGSNYTSANKIVAPGDSVLVGVIITKKEDDLKSFNVSVSYDASPVTNNLFNYFMTTAEYGYYSKDLWLKARNQAGTESLFFSVTDKDGNITQKSIVLTVQ